VRSKAIATVWSTTGIFLSRRLAGRLVIRTLASLSDLLSLPEVDVSSAVSKTPNLRLFFGSLGLQPLEAQEGKNQ